MSKTEILDQITRMICDNGLTLEEVKKHLQTMPIEQLFDVAVIDSDGKVRRLPLVVGEDMHPMGIYPFKSGPFSSYYIELTEQSGIIRKEAVSRRKGNQELPTREFWKSLEKTLPQLNEALKHIHGIAISGSYYARLSSSTDNYIWTIGQCESRHNPAVIARVRYVVGN